MLGVSFDWGPQVDDRDPTAVLEVALQHCPEGLEGAWVKFVEDPKAYCLTTHNKIAGCWRMEDDIIFLSPAPTLEQTALLHELTHRAQWLADGDIDMDHRKEPWWPLPKM